jgi:hypothetical protein
MMKAIIVMPPREPTTAPTMVPMGGEDPFPELPLAVEVAAAAVESIECDCAAVVDDPLVEEMVAA